MEKGIVICEETCIGCGQCVSDCVMENLVQNDGRITVRGQCLNCGHCVAICPSGAVSIPAYEMQEVEEYDRETFELCPEHVLHAVKFRRSVRAFQERKIEEEVLRRIVAAGVYTETAVNSQGVRFVVVQEQMDRLRELAWEGWLRYGEQREVPVFPSLSSIREYNEARKNDAKKDRLFFRAPAAVIVGSKVPLDGGLASANMEMTAVASGLGVMFDGYLVRALNHSEEALKWLGLNETPLAAAMLIGYPAVQYKRTAPRRKGNVTFL